MVVLQILPASCENGFDNCPDQGLLIFHIARRETFEKVLGEDKTDTIVLSLITSLHLSVVSLAHALVNLGHVAAELSVFFELCSTEFALEDGRSLDLRHLNFSFIVLKLLQKSYLGRHLILRLSDPVRRFVARYVGPRSNDRIFTIWLFRHHIRDYCVFSKLLRLQILSLKLVVHENWS